MNHAPEWGGLGVNPRPVRLRAACASWLGKS